MTGAEAHGGGRPGQSCSFPLPDSLTRAGRQAFTGLVNEYAAQLSTQLTNEARHRTKSVLTTHDVHAARYAYEQQLREQPDDRAEKLRRLAVLLLLGAVVLGVLASGSSGIGQAALLGLFVTTETAGLLLLWRGRSRAGDDSR